MEQGLLGLLRQALGHREPRRARAPHARAAAVLVPVYGVAGEELLVLTRRTDRVEYHKGQIAFPGGVRDEGDAGPVETALRESWEEIGLRPADVEVLGQLDDHVTTTGFCITPVVGVIRYSPYPFRPNPEEVAELFEVPLRWLLDPAHMKSRTLQGRGEPVVDYFWEYRGHVIWGATGRILKGLVELLNDQRLPKP